MAASMAMMAMTTNNSISVKADRLRNAMSFLNSLEPPLNPWSPRPGRSIAVEPP
jgi:hypothetical protein